MISAVLDILKINTPATRFSLRLGHALAALCSTRAVFVLPNWASDLEMRRLRSLEVTGDTAFFGSRMPSQETGDAQKCAEIP